MSPTLAGRRILVADDHRDAAEALAEFLKIAGHQVAVAYDGREALDVAEVFRPDFALLDLCMPRADGFEAVRQLTQRAWGSTVICMALTALSDRESRLRALEAGFHHYLIKPVDPGELIRLIQSYGRV